VNRAMFAAALFDDAALFPPGSAPMDLAVARHLSYRAGPLAPLVGQFVVGEARLAELSDAVPGREPFAVSLIAGGALPALVDDRVRVVSVETPAGDDPERRAAALSGLQVPVYLEPSWNESLTDAVAVAARHGMRIKLRTGGVRADLFPTPAELSEAIGACVRAEVPFKATAGLHHAVAHRDPRTGFAHHGFLNVLLATAAAVNGNDDHALTAILADRDARSVAARVDLAPDLATARRSFVSFGTCDIAEPVTDLVTLGLLPEASLQGLRR
jgi:hypothetical protein